MVNWRKDFTSKIIKLWDYVIYRMRQNYYSQIFGAFLMAKNRKKKEKKADFSVITSNKHNFTEL